MTDHDHRPDVLRGIASLMETLNCIGNENSSDHELSKIVCDNEMTLRELAGYALKCLTEEV